MEGGQGGEERAVLDLDDPKLEEKLVSELKAQGVFDQFRKDCLSDVDTKVGILLVTDLALTKNIPTAGYSL